MKPAVAGMPARPSIAIVIGHASSGLRGAEARARRRCRRRAPVSRSRATITANAARFITQVDGEVEDGRLHAELRRDDDAGEHVAGLRDRGPGEQALERGLAERADVADDDRDRRQRGERRRPVALRVEQRDVEEAQEHAERGGLRGHRHERRDRRRRALVDVGRPLVERRDRGLEGQARRRAARCR